MADESEIGLLVMADEGEVSRLEVSLLVMATRLHSHHQAHVALFVA